MPTARSSTSGPTRLSRLQLNHGIRSLVDVGHLLRFRTGTIRRRGVAVWAAGLMLGLTVAAILVPALVEGAGRLDVASEASRMLVLVPTALAGLLGLAVVSSIASGGGRELMPREQAVAYPISTTTDHLGALLMAPLNVAWLLQAWTLLGMVAFVFGTRGLVGIQVVTLLWIAVVTAVAQALGWVIEAIRRGPRGVVIVRAGGVLFVVALLALHLTHHLSTVLDRVPTRPVLFAMIAAREGRWLDWLAPVLVLAALLAAAVVLGAGPARLALRRAPRDELRGETGPRPARPTPRTDLGALVRIDRGSVWRSVPMRRGMLVLAIGPGLVAVLGNLAWEQMTLLPGLVASGGALLFGVNAWCLDGRGALWRESLPATPGQVFNARLVVLAEWLLVASGLTLALASLRSGLPGAPEFAALMSTWVVVTVQVVGAALRWSDKNPYATDMRSARATPAPPVVMVGYSARLALSTTLTGLLFSLFAQQPYWELAVAFAVPFVAWSAMRLLWVRLNWLNPFERARIVMAASA